MALKCFKLHEKAVCVDIRKNNHTKVQDVLLIIDDNISQSFESIKEAETFINKNYCYKGEKILLK